MPDFLYKARTATGELKSGSINAATRENAADLLAEHNLILVKLTEQRKDSLDVTKLIGPLANHVSMKDRVIFTRQLATMIRSGLPIVQALHILSEQTSNKHFAGIIKEISASVEGGGSLSAALQRYPKQFDAVYVNMTRSGEASGHMDEILDRLATQQEKTYRLASKVRGAMMYPAFVVVAMIAATILMMVVVVPPLKRIFADAGAQLPLPTRILMGASDLLFKYWWLMLILAVAGVFGLRRFLRSESGKKGFDHFKLRVPLFGQLFTKIYVARLTRTLASLVGGGVPILQSLEIVADSVGNSVYRKALRDAAQQVEAGQALSEPLRGNPVFPAMVPQMVSVGEQTGNMDKVLNKLADFYEEEVDNLVKNLTTLMEPILMVMMGIGVGGLLVAIMMPIYNLGNVI